MGDDQQLKWEQSMFEASLAGRVALITGAGRGIGKVFASALADRNVKVAIADVIETHDAVDSIRSSGGIARGFKCDITDSAQLKELVNSIEAEWGPIGILINNASLFATLKHKPAMSMEPAEWDRVMSVNARGTLQACQAVVPSMERLGAGKIVNIASGTVYYGPPGLAHYTASKAAVIALTRTLSRELGDKNIQVNAINPGLTESEAIRDDPQFAMARGATVASRAIKRSMEPEDLVGTLIYLCSGASDFVTGQTLNVDGGKVNT